MTTNCFDCNGTGIDKDFQSVCHCQTKPQAAAAPAPADAEVAALAAWLGEQTWSEFAQSLASYYRKNGRLSEKQIAAGTSMRTKVESHKAAKAAAAPKAEAAKPVSVPSGHYALVIDGVVKFYRVNNVTEGKWAGYTFVDAQASDDFHPIRNRASSREILALIAADVKGALVRYGHELGRCGVCRKTLTDAESIAAGIGPVCAGRLA